MRFLLKIFNLIRSWFKPSKTSNVFDYIVVRDLPDKLKINEILILNEGVTPELLAFKCPCGCEANIFLNLLKDASPRWRYSISKEDKISITPSVWKKDDCKSHFFITDGVIKWV